MSCLLLPAAPLALSLMLCGWEHPSCTGSCLSSCVPCPLPSLTTQLLGVGAWPVHVGSLWAPFLWGLLDQSAQWDDIGGHVQG